MRFSFSILLCTLAVALGAQDSAKSAKSESPRQQAASGADELVGSWRLVSVETIRPSGEVIYPFMVSTLRAC